MNDLVQAIICKTCPHPHNFFSEMAVEIARIIIPLFYKKKCHLLEFPLPYDSSALGEYI
jgi:hypothetical protein